MASLFVFAAIVQYNDPDPLVWALIYLAAAAVCLGVVVNGRAPLGAVLLVGAVAMVWALGWSRSVSSKQYLHMFDSWEMKSPGAEEARETSGLLIIAAWMAVLAGYDRFRRRMKNDAA